MKNTRRTILENDLIESIKNIGSISIDVIDIRDFAIHKSRLVIHSEHEIKPDLFTAWEISDLILQIENKSESESESTEAENDLIYYIKKNKNVSSALRNIHDFAFHHSSIDIDEEIKSSLYFVCQLSKDINKIERQN